MGKKKLLIDMAYEDYAVLVAHMDGEPYFRQGGKDPLGAFTEACDLFARECRNYRGGLVSLGGEVGIDPKDYASFLYNPVSFVTFGDTDAISVVAIDDFDPTVHLTSQTTLPIRQTCLAFCPTIKSLGLESIRANSKDTDSPHVFCSIEHLCSPSARGISGKNDKPRISLAESPLFSVTYFKLNWGAVLGPGLLLQQAVYRAMASRISEALNQVRSQSLVDRIVLEKGDLDTFRCIFLDPQGWSDIAVLMFANNYSITMTVLSALRQLRLMSLYETDGGTDLQDAINAFGIHRLVAEQSQRLFGVAPAGDASERPLSNNHIFCSTYSTLGVAAEEFKKPETSYKGVVIADTNLEIDPGHFPNVRQIIEERPPVANQFQEVPSNCKWYTIGQGDMSFSHLREEMTHNRKPLKLSAFIQQIKYIRDCDIPGNPDDHLHFAPNLLEIYSMIQVPAILLSFEPDNSGEQKKDLKHMDMKSLLSALQKSLFEKPEGSLNIAKLYKGLRKLRISTPLSHSIMNLYTDFATHVGDPFLFERVLDMYDLFVATHKLLAEELPQALDADRERLCDGATRYDEDSLCRTFLSNDDIEDLVDLAELLQNALFHRVQLAFRDAERWSTSLDVKGGSLDKLLNAADASLKCGLGILRRVMNGWTDAFKPVVKRTDEENKTRIGGASKISSNLRSLSNQLCIGPSPDFFLASVDLNITHLTRPSAFCIHLHETAHLICDLISSKGCDCDIRGINRVRPICYKNREKKAESPREITILERQQDIFSEILVHNFVFGDDHETYFRNYLAQYSLDAIAHCRSDQDTFVRLLEVLIRGFLITDPFRVKGSNPDLYSMGDKNKREISEEDVKKAFERFKVAILDAGPFFFDFDRLWGKEDKEFMNYVQDQFCRVYKVTYPPVCCIWKNACQIVDGVCHGGSSKGGETTQMNPSGTDPSNAQDRRFVNDCISTALKDGRPLARALFRVSGRDPSKENGGRLDPFFLIRALLKEHVRGILGTDVVDPSSVQVCLLRNAEDGRPLLTRPNGSKPWHTQLIDRNSNGFFAVDPVARRQYMRSRVTAIKTLWDVSTNLRARRMGDMLSKLKKT